MTGTTTPNSRIERARLTLLIDAASGQFVADCLRSASFSVEIIDSLEALTKRPHDPRPDAVVLVNSLSDGTVCAVHNLVQRRWRGVMVIVGAGGHAPHSFTPREWEVLGSLAVERSGTNRAVAKSLGVEPATVNSVIRDLMKKLGRRRAGLIAYAYALGLVTETAVETAERDDD